MTTNVKAPIRTAVMPDYVGHPAEYYVYAEANGLRLAHRVGGDLWGVYHIATGMPIGCPVKKWNAKSKTKVAKFFDYLVAAPFAWGDWKDKDSKPSWANASKAYRDAFVGEEVAA